MNIKCFNIGALGTNCYVCSGEDFLFVVDPAEQDKALLEYLSSLSNKPNKAILLTHCHIDHVLGLASVRQLLNCPVIIGEGEDKLLQNPDFNLSRMIFGKNLSFFADKTVKDNEIIRLGAAKISVVKTSGHTKGSVCYIIENVMFSGDTLFSGTIGRTDFPTSSVPEMLKSLRRLAEMDVNYRILAGHNEETTLFNEKRYNPFLRNNEFMQY